MANNGKFTKKNVSLTSFFFLCRINICIDIKLDTIYLSIEKS